MMLENINICLVEPSHSGNIGAAARAMKTMGLRQLLLVNPKSNVDDHAYALATKAADILDTVKIYPTVDEALAGARYIIGTRSREAAIAPDILNLETMAGKVVSEAQENNKVVILFGCERTGLTNDTLLKCHAQTTIATSTDFASLNLSHAVQIVVYELFKEYSNYTGKVGESHTEIPAEQYELQYLFEHIEKTLTKIKFYDPKNQKFMFKIQKLFMKARMTHDEVHIIRGIMTKIEQLTNLIPSTVEEAK